jgi:hypothetical protein
VSTFNTRDIDLDKLNSMTKYPSIPTYHTIDTSNGNLLEEPMVFNDTVFGTEKIDGTNARIIVPPGGEYILGSRETLLYARGDLIGDQSFGIVTALKAIAERCRRVLGWGQEGAIITLYGEVYGGKISAASKQYTGERTVGFRLFDVAYEHCYEDKFTWPRERIASWRDNGGQSFSTIEKMLDIAVSTDTICAPLLFSMEKYSLPKTIEETHVFLKKHLPYTYSVLDPSATGGHGEGIVIRTRDRSQIAKMRFEDYERTLKRRNASSKNAVRESR